MGLTELIYASAAARPLTTAELLDLLSKARLHNARLEVTGLLLHAPGSFLQVIEGPTTSVRTLFERIARDRRHSSIQVLREGEVRRRAFGAWGMGSVDLAALSDRVPGLNAFMATGTLASSDDHRRVRELLEGFRRGMFRRLIDAGELARRVG